MIEAVAEDSKVCMGDGEMFCCSAEEVGFVEVDAVDTEDVGGEVVNTIVATADFDALSCDGGELKVVCPPSK